MVSYKQAFHTLRLRLQALYDASEATAIAREVMEDLTGISYTQSLVEDGGNLPEQALKVLNDASEQLLKGKPMQYIVGYGWFMNHKFKVNESVLIPRPETEELVQWIIDDWKGKDRISVLDIGTGSGCIPISLKLALKNALVASCDISEGALNVARENATRLKAEVDFQQIDFLDRKQQDVLGQFDVIVSNPPYIPIAELETLHTNVRDYEPGTALFVPDNDPLLFYRAIALFAKTHLKKDGAVYCELHKDYAVATYALLEDSGYKKVELRQDMNGNERMLKAIID